MLSPSSIGDPAASTIRRWIPNQVGNDNDGMNDKTYYVYILASKRNGTLYIGFTNNLERRLYEHRHKLVKGFTEKYNIDRLVYYEGTSDVRSAIEREKQLKKWNRAWKLDLIEKMNPDWNDLTP